MIQVFDKGILYCLTVCLGKLQGRSGDDKIIMQGCVLQRFRCLFIRITVFVCDGSDLSFEPVLKQKPSQFMFID